MSDEIRIGGGKRIFVSGGHKVARKLFVATQTALALKSGRRVSVNGEEVVCVPGFDDGRQLPEKNQ